VIPTGDNKTEASITISILKSLNLIQLLENENYLTDQIKLCWVYRRAHETRLALEMLKKPSKYYL